MKLWLLFTASVLALCAAFYAVPAIAAEDATPVPTGVLNIVEHATCDTLYTTPVATTPYYGGPYYTGSYYGGCGFFQFIGSGGIGSFQLSASRFNRDDSKQIVLQAGDYSIAQVGAYPTGSWNQPSVSCTGTRRGRFFLGDINFGFSQQVHINAGETTTCVFSNGPVPVATATATPTSTPVPSATPQPVSATATPTPVPTQPQPIIVNVTVPPVPTQSAPVAALQPAQQPVVRIAAPFTGSGNLLQFAGPCMVE